MGGPPGARSGDRRRGYPPDWELRDSARFHERFQILDSEDEDGQGVILDPNSFAMREARQRGLAADALISDGFDLRHDRGILGGEMYDAAYDDDASADDDEYRYSGGRTHVAAARRKQDLVLHSALDRISRARAKGQTNVNLTQEEMDALERRGNQQLEPSPALISPPPTPAKSKVKTASRHSSNNSLSGRARKRSNSGFFTSPAKSNTKAKMTRKTSPDKSVSPPPGQVMIEGPNGLPMYAQIYQGPHSPEHARSARSRTGSRSSSKHSSRAVTPPDQMPPPLPPQPRFHPSIRPESQGSTRSTAEDTDWATLSSRARSSSNATSGGYRLAEDYDVAPPLPAVQGWRHSGSPSDVRYASLRRAAPSSPLASRTNPVHHGGSGLRRTETSGSSSSDDQGVLVDIIPDEHGGFAVRNSPARSHRTEPAPVPAVSSKSGHDSARKRKTRR